MPNNSYINSCIYFTFIVFIYSLIVALVNAPSGEVLLNAERVALFFVFSFMISLANGILSLKNLSRAVAIFIHYILFMIAAYLCLVLPLSARAATAVVAVALFSILYFVCLAIIAIIKTVVKKRKESKEEYTDRFNK